MQLLLQKAADDASYFHQRPACVPLLAAENNNTEKLRIINIKIGPYQLFCCSLDIDSCKVHVFAARGWYMQDC